jgi:hypothetical protein
MNLQNQINNFIKNRHNVATQRKTGQWRADPQISPKTGENCNTTISLRNPQSCGTPSALRKHILLLPHRIMAEIPED